MPSQYGIVMRTC